MRVLRHPTLAGLIAALIVSAAWAGHRAGSLRLSGLERLERGSLDLRFRLRGPVAPGPETVIVAFDDRSYAADPGLWERRAGWARVVGAIKAAGARVIGVDALFVEPERLLDDGLRADVADYLLRAGAGSEDDEAAALLRRIDRELRGDEALAAAIAEAGNVVLIMHLGEEGAAAGVADPSLARGRYGQSVLGQSPPRGAPVLVTSLPAFNRGARALGLATVFEDQTHTVRQVELARLHGQHVYAPLAVQAIARYLEVPRARLAYLGPAGTVRIGDRELRTSDDGASVWLNFRGPGGTFPVFSAIDLVEGRLPAGALDGKIVLVGMTHLGHDRARTAFGPGVAGVELQATLIDNLLRGDSLRRAPWWLDALLCLAVGLLAALLFWPRQVHRPWLQAAGALAILGGALAGTGWLFAARDLWISRVGPLASFGTAAGVALSVSYLGEGRQRRQLRQAFSHYLGDEVIRELLARPGALALGGERRRLTVLFSDIRDFTSISERLTPEQLVSFLNRYLTPMTRAVLGQGGLLDKYIGDAVMAVFGAPVWRAGHAVQALGCVLEMHRALDALCPELAREGIELGIGIGVNTGNMVVGNMGSAERFDYTVAGDAVNLASRLEGLTRVYGVFCVVGEETRAEAGAGFGFRELDLVQVKGKQQPVAVYELLSGPGRTLAVYDESERWDEALGHYRAGRFGEARTAMEAFAAANPADRVAALYLERLAALGDEPVAGWTGVFVRRAK